MLVRRLLKRMAGSVAALVAVGALFFLTTPAAAQLADGISTVDAANLGLATSTDLRSLVLTVTRWVLGFLGLAAVVIVIYGGVIWQTSAGNEERVARAKTILRNGLVGLVVVIFAFSIVSFVLGIFTGNFQPGTAQFSALRAPAPDSYFGALGGGIIDAVAPQPFEQNVARNTSIVIAFKEQVALSEMINSTAPSAAWRAANCAGVAVAGYCGQLGGFVKVTPDASPDVAAGNLVALTSDEKSFVIKPAKLAPAFTEKYLFGNAKSPTGHRVTLGALHKKNGAIALRSGYSWSFVVGTTLDSTAPRVVSVQPEAASTVPRNNLVQVTFSEPISLEGVAGMTRTLNNQFARLLTANESSAAGTGPGVTAVTVSGGANFVPGNWIVSNGFRTLTYVSGLACASGSASVVNSCGQTVFCLPSDVALSALLKSYREATNSGVQDLAGNPLDGNPGQPAVPSVAADFEDYSWNFTVGPDLDLVPPYVCETPAKSGAPSAACAPSASSAKASPDPGYSGDPDVSANDDVSRRQAATLRFSEPLDASSVNTEGLYLVKYQAPCAADHGSGAWGDEANGKPTASQCYDAFGVGVDASDREATVAPYSPYLSPETDYVVRAANSIRDLRQNCYNPAVVKP